MKERKYFRRRMAGAFAFLLCIVCSLINADAAEAPESGKTEYGSPENGENYDFSGIRPNKEKAEVFDRYKINPAEDMISTLMVTGSTELQAEIRKRSEWTNKENGDAQITLQYRSNSGTIEGTKDMNVILVHDKSGSMDANYGFKIQLEYEGLSLENNQGVSYYPIRNSQGWTENAAELFSENYTDILNYTEDGFRSGYIYNGEMQYNSPCQLEDHYYFLVKADSNSGYGEKDTGRFVHGKNLYNLASTDLHHYVKLGSREEALEYLAAGRRVIRTDLSYYNEKNKLTPVNEMAYFLDVSRIFRFHGNTYLSAPDVGCEGNDRLSRSVQFMKQLVKRVQSLNANNKIAYVPFWGDVPLNGSWENLSSGGSLTNLSTDPYEPQLTYKKGVSSIGFTSGNQFDSVLLPQIQNPFTYNGTNWTKAFARTISLLDARSAEDKNKETLIIFLTDGMPQGFSGKATDVKNPMINGVNEISRLKVLGESGVTVYACGVCLHHAEESVIQRLNAADSSGNALYADYVSDFDALLSKLSERIDERYKTIIRGENAFYIDKLEEEFSLDTGTLDDTWLVLDTPGNGEEKGVPLSVYRTIEENNNIRHIYVKSTNTVYWYIGEMTDGNYDTPGHTFSFSVKYSDYWKSTSGTDRKIQTNTTQKLVYESSANPGKTFERNMSSPQLLFHRDNSPKIRITERLSGRKYQKDTYYRFAYCRKKQKTIVKDADGYLTVTVKKGEAQGEAAKAVEPGVYYIYEIDEKGKIIQECEKPVTVSMIPEILTLKKSTDVPSSVISSDGDILNNYNNYLKLTAVNAEAVFENIFQTGDLTVTKKINASDDVIWWEHGNPIFMIRVKGIGLDGKEYSFFHTFEFTKAYVEENCKNGEVCMSYTFKEIPLSTEYRVEESRVSRYRLQEICGNDSNVIVKKEKTNAFSEMFGIYAEVDLKAKPENTEITFVNVKEDYQWYNHNAVVKNKINW